MNRRWITGGLIAAIVLQVGVLAGEYLGSVYPLWTGQPVRLETVPIDPRSLFRGNYVRLNYAISRISLEIDENQAAPRFNEVVYVKLRPGENNIYEFAGASLSQPQQGPYIRGRLQTSGWNRSGNYRVRYGIEAYFMPKEKALAMQDDLRDGGIAVVMLADNGKAALRKVIAEPGESSTGSAADG